MKKLQEEKSRYKGRILELDRKLNDATKLSRQREDLVKVIQHENEILKKKISLCDVSTVLHNI